MPMENRAAVDETLEACAGITSADLKNTGGILYLPDYDAYYNFTSDYGPGWFEAAEGVRDGDTARLRSEALWHEEGEVVRELTPPGGGRPLAESVLPLPSRRKRLTRIHREKTNRKADKP